MKSLLLFSILILFFSGTEEYLQIKLFNEPTFECSELKITAFPFDNKDFQDTIFVRYSPDGLPHSYFRRFQSEVCMTKECRPLDIFLYWSVTGRYLGYELPNGEFLSKTDHVKFKKDDYEQLHQLLTDPFSGLKNYRLEELVPSDYEDQVDAVSTATIADVKQYIVEDAVYTTYALWHLVYGETKEKIEKMTANSLSVDLLINVLNSTNQLDIEWGLRHIPDTIRWTEDLINKVIHLVDAEQIYTADLAVRAMPPSLIGQQDVQHKIFERYKNAGFVLKRKLLKKLEEAPFLYPEIQKKLAETLSVSSGSMVKNLLDLFLVHQVNDAESKLVIADLLKHDNRFIARKACQYLDNFPIQDKKVERMIRKYKNQMN